MKFKIVEEVEKPEFYNIGNYKFNPDGTLDVFENVYLVSKHLTELPFNFGKIFGFFDCSHNFLTSLKGFPEIVNGDFDCSFNSLTSLEGSPKIVNGDFDCYNNDLTSLNGLNLDGISGKIILKSNPDLKLTEKEQLWTTLNPGRLIL